MQYQFTGNSIALIGDYASGRGGSAKVYINNVVAATVSENGATENMAVV